ncbi:MAG: M28 family peptidase [Ginsengibacter sp.]
MKFKKSINNAMHRFAITKRLLPIVCCLLSIATFAQSDDAEKYASGITAKDLKKHLSIIASADMEGRETATAGQRKAAAYIEEQFKQIGLLHPFQLSGYQQSYPLFKDTLLSASLKIGKNKLILGKDFSITAGNALAQQLKSNEIIFVGYGISDKDYDDYAGKDVKGKIVVFFTGGPTINGKPLSFGKSRRAQWRSDKKAVLAKQKGAVAAFVFNAATDATDASVLANSTKTNLYYPQPVIAEAEKVSYLSMVNRVAKNILGDEAYTDLVKKANRGESLNTYNIAIKSKTKLAYKKIQIPFSSTNVIGYLEGSDKKNEYVFLTGHYDHLGKKDSVIYYGADDDGSGTVSVIEMAQSFAKAKAEGHGPRRTIVFMTVSGEEKGLWGSEYYTDHPLFSLEKTTVDLNTDMVGRIDPDRKIGDSNNYVYVVGDDKISSELKVISIGINKKYVNLELDYKYNDPNDRQRIYYRSDHYNFAKKGVPVIFYYDGMLRPDYHRPTDTIDKINFSLMEKRVKFIFLTAWDMANRENMLKRDIPLPAL